MNILIVRSGALGGILAATKIAKAIREKLTPARISWLTCSIGSELVSHCSSIDDFSIDVVQYQSIQWDILITPSVGNDTDLKLASLFNSRRTIGLIIDKNNNIVYEQESVEFLKIRNDRNFRAKLGISTEILCIKKLGLDTNNAFYDYQITSTEYAIAKTELDKITLSHKRIIGIHFGSSSRWDSKKLPISFLISLLSELVYRFSEYYIVVFVGPREEEFIVSNNGRFQNFGHVHFLQNYTLNEVIAMVSSLGLLISTDSFLMHAAIAVRKNVIALFGPTSKSEIDFFELGTPISLELKCSPCFAKQKNECKNDVKMHCVNNLPIELIIAALQKYITG